MSPLVFGIVRTRGRFTVLREVLDSILAETICFFEAVVATMLPSTPRYHLTRVGWPGLHAGWMTWAGTVLWSRSRDRIRAILLVRVRRGLSVPVLGGGCE
jgi:hypothetical protein